MCELMCFCMCVSVCGHVCVDAIVSLTVSLSLSSAVEQQPRRLTAHVQSPKNLVPQLRCTMTKEKKIYFIHEIKPREGWKYSFIVKQLKIQFVNHIKLRVGLIASSTSFCFVVLCFFVFSSCLHEISPKYQIN